jgi:hypothetical protein
LLPELSTMAWAKSIPVASNKVDLSGAIQEVLENPSYRDSARRFQRTIAEAYGLDRAADVLERAFSISRRAGWVVCGLRATKP